MGNETSKTVDYENAAVSRSGSLLLSKRSSAMASGARSSPGSGGQSIGSPPPYSPVAETPLPPLPPPRRNPSTGTPISPPPSPTQTRRRYASEATPSTRMYGTSVARANTVARSPPPPPVISQPPRSRHSVAVDTSTQPALAHRGSAAARRASTEDPLLMLRKFDTVIIVDDSSSMAGALWFEAQEALAGIADLAHKHDTDGIDIHFLNDRRVGRGLTQAEAVQRLFNTVEPNGITPTGEKLEELLLEYMLKLEDAREEANKGNPAPLQEIKPVNYIVITDGAPTDDPETVIVTVAQRLDAGRWPIAQVGIQFVQIGNDPSATEALQELDDDLAGKYGIRDIVDTTLYSGRQLDANTLIKILLGGVNRRVDRRGMS